MLKKCCALVLSLLLAAAPLALAESIPSDQYFIRGKDALGLLAQGREQEALDKLAFSYAQSDASNERFLQFVKDYLPALSEQTVQRDVAVCYWEAVSSQWLLAIPISEPTSDDVMALVLMSSDFETFTGYAALSWAEVNEGTAASEYVWWNVEYDAGTRALYAD
ncbi:MAG: hypothetical protein IJ048_04360 [Clostridia bacterium]|nr:hypothetical protein [Clostridia bacterium]